MPKGDHDKERNGRYTEDPDRTSTDEMKNKLGGINRRLDIGEITKLEQLKA